MGLFSDQCGECGSRVKKAAKFCSKCGTAPAKGWWKCSSCGKWVGAGSEFCWSCKAPMHIESRAAIAGGRWARERGVFAERFEVQDLEPLLKKGLTIETGCAAILLKDGTVKDVLEAGVHTLDTAVSRLARWGKPSPKTVVLLDASEIGVPVRVENLRTKEDMAINFYGEVIFRFNPNRADDLMQNLLKERRRLTVEDLAEAIAQEIRFVLTSYCQESTGEELIRDPLRRLGLEDRLQGELTSVLERVGLELERVGGCDFTGPDYEKLRAQSGELETTRRKLEMDQRLRELMTSEMMDDMKSESAIEEYVAQLAQERDLGNEDRSHELNLLKQVHRHELEGNEAAELMQREMEKTGHDIGIQIQWDGYNREKAVADAKNSAEVRTIEFAQEVKETEQALKWREQKNKIAQDDLKAKAEIYKGHSLETLIALVEDPQQREQLVKLHEQQMKAGVSEKEILAAAKLESLEEQKKMTEENAKRLEGVMREALKAMGEAAKGGNTIIK